MTLEYMIDVMTRAKAGEQVQVSDHGGPWGDTTARPNWNWSGFNYRIKPREPRVIWVGENPAGALGFTARTNKEHCDDNPVKFVEVLDDD